LYLSRVKVHARTLDSLITPSLASFQAITLREVELKSGTWEGVFKHLLSLPTVTAFSIQSSGYSTDNESALYAPDPLPQDESLQELESLRIPEDYLALSELKTMVNKRRQVVDQWRY
jgi:hypothetical protein